ncbi:MAG: hypothetical protein QM813_11110 [Verrucomicrobiota bacterium]
MITVKILCGCGQKYAFDVEPYQGRMPSSIQCPVCKTDGTQAANEIIARTLPPAPIPAAAPPPQMVAPPPPRPMSPASSPGGLRIGGAAAAPALKPVQSSEESATEAAPHAQPASGLAGLVKGGARAALRGADGDEDEDKWKWWYYVLAGIGIIGYQGWLLYENGFYTKYVSGIFGGLCCIGVGIWSFQRKRAAKA